MLGLEAVWDFALRIESVAPPQEPKRSIPTAKATEVNTTPIFLID
jgi:hypothetical protein